MNKFFKSATVSAGLLAGLFLVLNIMVGRGEEFILRLAGAWRRLRASPDVNEFVTDLGSVVGIVSERVRLISWTGWAAVGVVIGLVSVTWFVLVTRARAAETERFLDKLKGIPQTSSRRPAKAKTDAD